MNKVILIGRTTKEIELRRTGNGTPVTQFTLAVDNKYEKDEKGANKTIFINCVAWNKLAETILTYVPKGRKIAIEGRIQTRSYDNKEGTKVFVTEVVVEQLHLLEYSRKDAQQNEYQYDQVIDIESNSFESSKNNNYDFQISEDDLPF